LLLEIDAQKDEDIDEDVCLAKLSGVLCGPRVSQKLKDKFYMTVIQLAMLYEQNVGLLKDDMFNN
jgi:hypothetical protein